MRNIELKLSGLSLEELRLVEAALSGQIGLDDIRVEPLGPTQPDLKSVDKAEKEILREADEGPTPTEAFDDVELTDEEQKEMHEETTAQADPGEVFSEPVQHIGAAVGEELDPDGQPWDERIHASSKARLAKGNTWKLKRGIDATLVEQVRVEHRNRLASTPAATPADTPADTPAALSYETIAARVTNGVSLPEGAPGRLDPLKVGPALAAIGLTAGLPELQNRPDLFEAANAAIDGLLV